MGLYLCVFEDDRELEGVEVGSYGDFGCFRDKVQSALERGEAGSRFPVLMKHSDCDGQWSPEEVASLQLEIVTIAEELGRLPAEPLPGGWKTSVARQLGLVPRNLRDCFFDVDGEPLLDRLFELCRCSLDRRLPILFQ